MVISGLSSWAGQLKFEKLKLARLIIHNSREQGSVGAISKAFGCLDLSVQIDIIVY